MKAERWNNGSTKIETWIENHEDLRDDDEYADSFDLIELNLRRGARNPAKRLKFWNQILAEGRDFPAELNWPIKQGKESNLPNFVRISLTELGNAEYNDHHNLAVSTDVLDRQFISSRNTEHGGVQYSTLDNGAELYASAKKTSTIQRFTKLYNKEQWNGKTGSDMIIMPPTTQDDDSSGDEEE